MGRIKRRLPTVGAVVWLGAVSGYYGCARGQAAQPRAEAEPGQPVTVLRVQPAEGAARPAGPLTIGMIFPRGRAPESVVAVVDDKPVPTQVDTKRHWADGSLKHAVLTFELPEVDAGADLEVVVVTAQHRDATLSSPSLHDTLGAHDLKLDLSVHNGPARAVSLSQVAAEAAPRRRWLEGPLAVEWLLKTRQVTGQGAAPDPNLEVYFRVRHYPRAKSTRVVCVLENTRWDSPGNVLYDLKITRDGETVYDKTKVGPLRKKRIEKIGHPRWARGVKRYWFGRRLDDVNVAWDRAYLNSTGLLPRYDVENVVSQRGLDAADKALNRGAWDLFENGTIATYFPMTGGRPDFGPVPEWTARWIQSQAWPQRRHMMGNADQSGSAPIHLRDPETGGLVSIDKYPEFSLNPRGTHLRLPTRDAADSPWILPPESQFSCDSAHQSSFAYVPYLITGDLYYLEETQFWANWNMLKTNYQYRGGAKGYHHRDQVRGAAWAMRALAHAAAISPDDSWERQYFEDKLQNCLRFYEDFVNGPDATVLGSYTIGVSDAYTRGWPGKDRYFYATIAPWQHNFLVWTMSHIADLGHEGAIPMRDYLMKYTIGAFTQAESDFDPIAGTAYYHFLGEREDPDDSKSKWRWYTTYRDISQATWHHTIGEPAKPMTKVNWPYGLIARMALLEAVRAEQPGAEEALAMLNELLPNREDLLSDNAKWAMQPVKPEHR